MVFHAFFSGGFGVLGILVCLLLGFDFGNYLASRYVLLQFVHGIGLCYYRSVSARWFVCSEMKFSAIFHELEGGGLNSSFTLPIWKRCFMHVTNSLLYLWITGRRVKIFYRKDIINLYHGNPINVGVMSAKNLSFGCLGIIQVWFVDEI